MEVTKTFVNAFPYMLLAKLRWFVRRSIVRYAFATGLIAYGAHSQLVESIASPQFIKIWMTYFLVLCLFVLAFHIVTAAIQSVRLVPRQVTFKKDEIIIVRHDTSVVTDWDWIISAEESSEFFAFVIRRFPRLELFLAKDNLSDEEFDSLRQWLVGHGILESQQIAT